jgi:hypothetical protein
MIDRKDIIEQLVEKWTDAMDLGDLINFFADAQREYLEQESDEDLLNHAGDANILEEITE